MRGCAVFLLSFLFALLPMRAMTVESVAQDTVKTDSLFLADSIAKRNALYLSVQEEAADTADMAELLLKDEKDGRYEQKKIKTKFVPNPKRALWLALVIPGAGQIYNRKYWKLPFFYGGFLGCTYALIWNQQMYTDYSQAYLDITDADPNTASYTKMLPPTYDTTGKEEYLQNMFKRKKDYYRRYRDLSAFAFAGVYILSVIDAYVDAQLSAFDISRDLSLQIRPAVITNTYSLQPTTTMGVGCSLNF